MMIKMKHNLIIDMRTSLKIHNKYSFGNYNK